jgi:hypothetical protein
MAKNENGNASEMEDASKPLKAQVDRAAYGLRSEVDRSVNRGRELVREHPIAALGIALGVTFAAGAITGAQMHRRMKSKQSEVNAA